jgi:GTP-binding protein EngB required for normal cell division
MHEGSAKTVFPHYIPDISPVQSACIEDHISLIRTRLISAIECSGIDQKKPDIPASRAVGVRLASIQVSIDELRPQAMRSFGKMDHEGEVYLSGIVSELRVLTKQVEQVLTRSDDQDIGTRLKKLEKEGNDITLLRKAEELVTLHGLVEYQGTIASILNRIEDDTFEIAVFGRVSSGKSSLLNTILEQDILPVGVTPVTALPIHIRWGEKPEILVSFIDKKHAVGEMSELPKYATEQNNPSNIHHVTRIVVSLPADRLLNGVGFADTPGLGSLATSGAAETFAYLPTCDLGIVLIDAGSTLTAEDIHTVYALQQAAIPVQILISKADLLSERDQASLAEYIITQIYARCNERYPVQPVSTRDTHRYLLDTWFRSGILPLVTRAREMKTRSLQRKIGLLWDSIQETLSQQQNTNLPVSPERRDELNHVETVLRGGSARIEELRTRIFREYSSAAPDLSELWIQLAKTVIAYVSGHGGSNTIPDDIIRTDITRFVHHYMKPWHDELSYLATDLHQILVSCAEILNTSDVPDLFEFVELIRDMPLYDPGHLEFCFSFPALSSILGQSHLEKGIKNQLKEQMRASLSHSLGTYFRLYGTWMEAIIKELERVYEATAGKYRANISRIINFSR